MLDSDPFAGLEPPDQRTIRQHYVAASYLMRYTKPDESLCVYDKKSGVRRISHPRAVAYEKNFHQLGDGAKDELAKRFDELQLAERGMQHFEGIFNEVANDVVQIDQYFGIHRRSKAYLSRHIAIQFLRSRGARERILSMQRTMLTAACQDELKKCHGERAGEYRVGPAPEHETLFHLGIAFSPVFREALADLMDRHIWFLAIAPPSSFFVTSDDPVAIRAHIVGKKEAYDGFGSPGVEICFPVSSRLAIVIRERTYHRHSESLDMQAVKVSPQQVRFFNRMQAVSSRRWLFCESDEMFEDLVAFCEKHPWTKDPEREIHKAIVHKPRKHKGSHRQLIHGRSVERTIDWTFNLSQAQA